MSPEEDIEQIYWLRSEPFIVEPKSVTFIGLGTGLTVLDIGLENEGDRVYFWPIDFYTEGPSEVHMRVVNSSNDRMRCWGRLVVITDSERDVAPDMLKAEVTRFESRRLTDEELDDLGPRVPGRCPPAAASPPIQEGS